MIEPIDLVKIFEEMEAETMFPGDRMPRDIAMSILGCSLCDWAGFVYFKRGDLIPFWSKCRSCGASLIIRSLRVRFPGKEDCAKIIEEAERR